MKRHELQITQGV